MSTVSERSVRARALRSDEGTSLAELLVYVIVLSIVLVLVVTTFINGQRLQRDQASLADASNEAQIAATSMENEVRNAVSIQVDNAVFGGDLLVVKTRRGEKNDDVASWICRAWFFDESTGALYTTSSVPGPGATTAGITTVPDLSTWRHVVSGIRRLPDHPIFETTGVGGGATLRYEAESSRPDAPVLINTTAIPRLQGPGIGKESCGEYL